MDYFEKKLKVYFVKGQWVLFQSNKLKEKVTNESMRLVKEGMWPHTNQPIRSVSLI